MNRMLKICDWAESQTAHFPDADGAHEKFKQCYSREGSIQTKNICKMHNPLP